MGWGQDGRGGGVGWSGGGVSYDRLPAVSMLTHCFHLGHGCPGMIGC